MKIFNTEFEPLRPIPASFAYDKFKQYLKKHAPLHYFLHLTYCRLVLNYSEKKPYIKLLQESKKVENLY
jgi:hypothetical protein